ncbi:hypothetical protein M8I35_04365 [Micromonospora sp. MSM11]|nr:hypothetical protein [Micromonospora sp. MSM11]MCL7456411.1 hypothetical protein [Micromonospora sp. MSM11]
MRAIDDALAQLREERDTTHSQFQEPCAVVRHDAALIEAGSKQEPSQGATPLNGRLPDTHTPGELNRRT